MRILPTLAVLATIATLAEPCRAQPVGVLYTGHRFGIYQVDLTTGVTQQMAEFPAGDAAGFAYQGSAIGVAAADWWNDLVAWQQPDCSTHYANWVMRYGPPRDDRIIGYAVDTTTWEVVPNSGWAPVAGIFAQLFDTCDMPALETDTILGSAVFVGDGSGQTFGGPPVFYAVVNPTDSTIWAVTGSWYGRGDQLNQIDPVQGLLLSFDGSLSGKGPIAFDLAGNLWRYTYDDDGNAWLNQVDLTTGGVLGQTVTFSAPAESMWFAPQ